MAANNSHAPGLPTLLGKIARTGMGAVLNRGELLAVEWQEERQRLIEMMAWTVGWLFFAVMGMVMLTATIILLVPEDKRVYVTGAFTVLYFATAVWVWFILRKLIRQEAFEESLGQIRKDAECLDSFR
jgi:uncharacterized membrane protein YqjE